MYRDGKTLAEVGNSAGVANRAGSMGAGRALVHMGLIAVHDALCTLPCSGLVELMSALDLRYAA